MSGLYLASDAELKKKGWLPYIEEPATLSTYELTDGTDFKIEADRVVGVEKKRAMTDTEKTEHDEQVTKHYQIERQWRYGTIENQLDMMYHETWRDHIKAVKDKYPKPE